MPRNRCVLLFILPFIALNHLKAQSMYCGKADHNTICNSGIKGSFSELAWKFDADAAIRSTPLAEGGFIYFGSSRGVFYKLNKNTGKVNWTYTSGHAINSSAAFDKGNVFFSDNKQSLYSLNAATGKLNWKADMGKSKDYPWAFDYTYSSPAIINGQILIGSKDGCVYNIDEATGKVKWKFKTEGIVRSSPAVADNTVYAGDTGGDFFAISLQTGKQKWRFELEAHSLQNEKFGFDRRAIIASPVVAGNKVIIGGRDGFLYVLDKNTGKQSWKVNHEVSWIMGAVAIKGNTLVTGTSDGHFVQALDLNSSKELWKFHTQQATWSSPVIDGDKVYTGSFEGQVYCIGLKTGNKISSFQTGNWIIGSAVIGGQMLYIGSDDGFLYALKAGTNHLSPAKAHKYVYYDKNIPSSLPGNDARVSRYLANNGYTVLDKVKLIDLLNKKEINANSVIVFATNFFPPEIYKGEKSSALRNYLNQGGKVVVMGTNPLMLSYDEKEKAVGFRNFVYPDSVIDVKYGPNDLRSHKGYMPSFRTKTGAEWGMKSSWTSAFGLDPKQVDIVLGTDENGLASAWVKKFSKAPGSGFVQIWTGATDTDLSFITRVAEYGLN